MGFSSSRMIKTVMPAPTGTANHFASSAPKPNRSRAGDQKMVTASNTVTTGST